MLIIIFCYVPFMYFFEDANGRRLVQYQDPEPINAGGLQFTAGHEHFGSFAIPLGNSKHLRTNGIHCKII